MKTIGKGLVALLLAVFTLFCIWASFCWLFVWIDALQAVSISGSESAEEVTLPSVEGIASSNVDECRAAEVTV